MDECKARVVVNAANVRVRPDASSGVQLVGIANRNDELPVHEVQQPTGDPHRWFRVTLPANDATGWIREDLVQLVGKCADFGVASLTPPVVPIEETPEGEIPPPATPPEKKMQGDLSVLAGDCKARVKVFLGRARSKPALDGDTVGMLRLDTVFTVGNISEPDADDFRWYSFEHEGQAAWMREDILEVTGDCHDLRSHVEEQPSLEEKATQPQPEPETKDTGCTMRLNVARANVRPQPTTLLKEIGVAMQDKQYPVIEVTQRQIDGFRWVKIDFDGQAGFIRMDLASLTGDCDALIPQEDLSNLPDIQVGSRLPSPVAVPVGRGWKDGHPGLDFPVGKGALLRVAVPGVVERAHHCKNCDGDPPNVDPSKLSSDELSAIFRNPDWGWGYGHHVIIRHDFSDLPSEAQQRLFAAGAKTSQAVFVLYAHMSRMDVATGDVLQAGTPIGLTGNTGNSTGAHLHLETAYGSQWLGGTKFHPADIFDVDRKFS